MREDRTVRFGSFECIMLGLFVLNIILLQISIRDIEKSLRIIASPPAEHVERE